MVDGEFPVIFFYLFNLLLKDIDKDVINRIPSGCLK